MVITDLAVRLNKDVEEILLEKSRYWVAHHVAYFNLKAQEADSSSGKSIIKI